MAERNIQYPAKTIFKAIFRPRDDTLENIQIILTGYNLDEIEINCKESKTGKFKSFTVGAIFPSKIVLNQTCDDITSLKGFMSLF